MTKLLTSVSHSILHATVKLTRARQGHWIVALDRRYRQLVAPAMLATCQWHRLRRALHNIPLVLIAPLLFSSPVQAQTDQTLLHKQAISQQIALYAHRWDGKLAESFAELFTEDARMDRWLGGKLVEASVIEGKQAILDYARRSHNGRLADRQTRHHMTSIVFLEIDGDTALTENAALITHQTRESTTAFISGTGVYRISWRNTDKGWKITQRTLLSDSAPSGN